MTARETTVGDLFRVVGEAELWRRTSVSGVHRVEPGKDSSRWAMGDNIGRFGDRPVEVVERLGDIGRAEHLLILRGGAVVLEFAGNWRVYSHTPGDPMTEFVLTGSNFGGSESEVPTAETAIGFALKTGASELGRPNGSEVFAFGGRVYARATNFDVTGKKTRGAYKRLRKIDGVQRLIIAGLLTLPGEPALYDIIMEHFGPDTVPR